MTVPETSGQLRELFAVALSVSFLGSCVLRLWCSSVDRRRRVWFTLHVCRRQLFIKLGDQDREQPTATDTLEAALTAWKPGGCVYACQCRRILLVGVNC